MPPRRPSRYRRLAALATAALLTTGTIAQPLSPAVQAAVEFALPAQPLDQALAQFARQAGLQLAVSPELLRGLQAPSVSGPMEPAAALAQLLKGSGLQGRIADGLLTLERAASAENATALPTVRVTASAAPEDVTGPLTGYLARRTGTANKTDTPIAETPQSISVVTADKIDAIGATRLNEALAYTPGVSTTTYGTDSRFDWISVRGFDAYSPGFYQDGLPLRNIATWAVWKTENYGAERIELLRGPASVLYGQSSPGGLVNVVSKRPTAEPLHELQLQLGDHQRKQLAGDFSGPLGDDGTLSYRLTAFARDAELPAGHMADDRQYLASALTWRPSSDTSLTLLSHVDRVRAGTYVRNRRALGSLVSTSAGTTVPTDLYTGEPGFNRFHQDQWALGYLFEHRLAEGWTLRQNARYGEIDVDYRQLTGGSYIAVNSDATDPANYRSINRSVFTSREKAKAAALDNQLQATARSGDWQHTLLAGLDYQRSRFDQVTASGSGPSFDLDAPVYGQAVTLPDPYADAITTVTQTGLYLQDQIKWGERWVATLGLRHDRATGVIDSRLDGSSTRMPDRHLSRRAGLVYLHPDGWAPYLGYSESFVPTATLDATTGQPLDPETGRQLEAGLRYQPPGQQTSYSAAVFELKRQNYITYDDSYAPHQTGEVVVRGLELEATLQPLAGTQLTLAYTFTPKADVTASVNPLEVGKQLTAVPRHRLSGWADHRLGFGLTLGLGLRYVGANRGDGEAAPAEVPATTIFDALVGYELGSWHFALNLRNLADKTYIANCDAYGNCYYGEARRITATAAYRW